MSSRDSASTSRKSFASFVAGAAVAVTLLAAGLSKAVDIPEFRASLETWKLFAPLACDLIAWGVPYLEIAASLAWLLGSKRRIAISAMLAILICSTGAYTAHLIFSEAPTCLCFGVMDRYGEDQSSTRTILLRNAVLIVLAIIGVVWRPDILWRNPWQPRRRAPLASVPSGKAFSLIEMLLVIAISAVLLSLLVPVMQRFRARARMTIDLSNLRQHATVFAAYGNDNKEIAPYVTRAEWDYTVLRCGEWVQEAPYFYAAFLWPAPLASGYYEGQCSHRSFASPVTPTRLSLSDYHYSCSFVARPEYWRPETRQAGRSQWGPTRFGQVLWPTRKCLLARVVTAEYVQAVTSRYFEVYDHSLMSGVPVPLAFVDGSGRFVDAPDVLAGYPEEDAAASVHTVDYPYPLHTVDGVRGFDVQ